MKPPFETVIETARGGTITQRELDDLAVGILESASELVRFHDGRIKETGYTAKRNKELAEVIKSIGAETLLMFTEPGGRAVLQSFDGRGRSIPTDPGSRIGKRLAAYAEGLTSRHHVVSRDIEAVRADLADPSNVSDELALAVRVLDRHDSKPYFGSHWLSGLSDRAHALTHQELTGYPIPSDVRGIPEHFSKERHSNMKSMIQLVDLTRDYWSNDRQLAIWLFASHVHGSLRWGGSSNDMIGHFDTWPDGLVEVLELPRPGSDWHEDTSVAAQLGTLLRNGKTTLPSTRCAFRVAVTLDELLLGRDELLKLVAERCVRKAEYLSDIQIEHIGPMNARHDYRPARLGNEGELLMLLNVVADGSALLRAYMDGTLEVPKTKQELEDEAWRAENKRQNDEWSARRASQS